MSGKFDPEIFHAARNRKDQVRSEPGFWISEIDACLLFLFLATVAFGQPCLETANSFHQSLVFFTKAKAHEFAALLTAVIKERAGNSGHPRLFRKHAAEGQIIFEAHGRDIRHHIIGAFRYENLELEFKKGLIEPIPFSRIVFEQPGIVAVWEIQQGFSHFYNRRHHRKGFFCSDRY